MIVKLRPEKGFGWQQTLFLFFQVQYPFLSDFLYIFGKTYRFLLRYWKQLANMSNMFHILCYFMSYSVIFAFQYLTRPLQCLLFCFFTAQKINIMIYFYYTSLTATTAIHCSMKNNFLLIDPFRKSPSCVEFIVFLSTSQKIESLTRSQNDSGI